MKICVVQITSNYNIEENLVKIINLTEKALEYNPDLIAFPENFGYMITEGKKPDVSDKLYDKVINILSKYSKQGNTYILAGTLPEKCNSKNKFYNTLTVLNREGNIECKYRKIHLFDIELENKSLMESKFIEPGNKIVTFKYNNNIICGLSICYDLRFPLLYRKLIDEGANVIFVPAAFTMRTGKDHWEALLKARAIENQCYIIAPAQYGKHGEDRESYGHSMMIDPWGTVIAQKGVGEGIIFAEIEENYIQTVRNKIPCLKNRVLKT